MSNVSDGTTGPDQGTVSGEAAPEQPLDLEGFAEAMANVPGMEPRPPEMAPEGDPESAEAVDKDAEEQPAPDAEADQDDESVDEPDADEESPDEAEDEGGDDVPPVNFDGFTDSQKTILEGLLSKGHVDSEFVEELRKGTLRQADYTRKTMALADSRRDWEKEVEGLRADLSLLEKIRGDDRLHDAWLRMQRGDYQSDDADGEDADELLDAKRAKELIDRRLQEREAESKSRTQQQEAAYAKKRETMREAVQDGIKALGVEPTVMQTYLEAEEATLPPNVDPILHFDPSDLMRRVALRHEAAVAKARAEKAEAKLAKRTAKEDRAAKQSLPPAPRRSVKRGFDPLRETEESLGLDQSWSNVQGWGYR